MYLRQFDPWEIYLALYLYYFVVIISLQGVKNGSYQPWFTLYHIILTVKVLGGFWAGFCELLGWKSSILSGNTGAEKQGRSKNNTTLWGAAQK